MKHKNVPVDMAPPELTDGTGTFEAVVSVFNNKDLAGDIVRPGAFAKSLEHWKAMGNPIPVYWSHRLDDPTYNIGQVIEAREITGSEAPDWAGEWIKSHGGLYVKAQLDAYGLGEHVGKLLKARRVNQFSFSYDVLQERKAKDGSNELLELWVHEVGPTPLGCNPLTELLAAKSNPDPPEPPDEQEPPTEKRRDAALFSSRLAIDIARWQYELAD